MQQLHCRFWGDPAAPRRFLLIHGFAANMASWGDGAQGVAEAAGAHVLAVDLPGCSGSLGVELAECDFAGYADAVVACLDARSFAPTHVLGHSFGGLVALHVRERLSCPARCLLLAPPLFGGRREAEEVFSRQDLPTRYAVLHARGLSRALRPFAPLLAPLRGCCSRDGTLGWYVCNYANFTAPHFAAGVRSCLLRDTEGLAVGLARPGDALLMGRRDPLYARNGPPPGLRARWAWTDAAHVLDSHSDLATLLAPWW